MWLNNDQNCQKKVDLFVLAISKNDIRHKSGKKNNYEIYLLQLEDK